jgi:hypothetical protein
LQRFHLQPLQLLGRHCSVSLPSGCGTLFSLKRIMDLIHKMFRIVSPLMSIKFGHDGSVNGENLKTKSTFYGSLIPYKHDLHLI